MAKKKAHPPEGPDALLDEATAEFLPQFLASYYGKTIGDVPSGKTLLSQDRDTQAAVVRVALERLKGIEERVAAFRNKLKDAEVYNPHLNPGWAKVWHPRLVLTEALRGLLRRALPLREADVIGLLQWPVKSSNAISPYLYPLSVIASAVEHFAESNEVRPSLAKAIQALVDKLRADQDRDCRKVADRLQALLSGGPTVTIEAGEAWSDAALLDLKKMKAGPKRAWNALLVHCQTGGKGKCTERWLDDARPLLDAVGRDAVKEHLLRWFPLIDKPRTQPFPQRSRWLPADYYDHLLQAPHVELLRGLIWCCGLKEDADLARAVGKLALSSYRKIPGKGPRLVSLGNACVTALGMMPGKPPIGQLALLKVKVKFGTAQKEIEKAFNTSAAREGLPRDEIEELAVPSYGLEEVGHRRETFGEYEAELLVDGSAVALHWHRDGKPLKTVPAQVKQDHAEELRELQGTVKDMSAMLPAQRERIDTLFLARKSWPLAVWKERYLDHPLVGTIGRRLIWVFSAKGKELAGMWADELVNAAGKPLTLKDNATVSLWHPIGHSTDEVLAWRDFLERREIVQPFKQAHREVYLLTDAERRTGTYSNRFAAHILRQHQFHSLCAARGWKNKLRLMVDDSYPPAHRPLPQWGVRGEYWIEGAGSEYGRDTTESGSYLYLSTDQVRFYAIEAPQLHAHAGGGGYGRYDRGRDEPLSLDKVPPLVFSEVMRDVDLFVGVASVGNDPNWADGGPGGQYRDYWRSYSFGELSATAQTRKALLQRLLPRLKIADRCSLRERFLVVRGSLRTYKIHLGSGNILMEPDDQYLCIVPKQTVAAGERVFLPFEGDGTLSIILSKAFLLADDAKIKDKTITNQLTK